MRWDKPIFPIGEMFRPIPSHAEPCFRPQYCFDISQILRRVPARKFMQTTEKALEIHRIAKN
jgi:hypothetical protein